VFALHHLGVEVVCIPVGFFLYVPSAVFICIEYSFKISVLVITVRL